ncbi:hypothetical protein MPTK1_1g25040 [Marchantia polymorpha subsp. ruderalis]|uniref:Uncharacterized protein n=2 Tax=Marchantia polymorpha TaxID=3197 RepID=A0AAF6AU23_MARPO|nr:hypothetical protein MARPO_0061s0021 [Marchantia polymorpha]BBM99943.1 hypothetical protein Mp_1g25040 [Marchantia polymorpha subsp. ruderalis]|eukprot:PTQ36743.1 hypothetical protein MARPO_0061s0021 [Marchantia polymorpha]
MIPHLSVGVLVLVLVLTGFFSTAYRVSVSLLHGLHAYLLPEAGEKEETAGKGKRRPQGSARQKKGKKDSKDVWDEAGSQILRIDLAESQLETRKYFQEYDEAIIYTILGLTNFVTREILQFTSAALQTRHEWARHLAPDERITFMVGAFTCYKLLRLLARVGFDPRLARSSERWWNWGVGFLGFAAAYILLIVLPVSVVDFGIDGAVLDAGKAATLFMQKKGVEAPMDFSVSPMSVKVIIALFSGIVSGLLFGASLRNVKNYWVGTDHLLWNIAVLKRGPLVRDFLHLSLFLAPAASLIWFKPMAAMFLHPGKPGTCGGGADGFGDLDAQSCGQLGASAEGLGSKLQNGIAMLGVVGRGVLARDYDWAADLGFAEDTFHRIQLWALFVVGALQVSLFRVNLQSYCNGAVLSWYRGLHQSKVHNPEVTKAKIFLNNYFVCRIALQSLVPGVLVLHFLGLARTRGMHLDEAAEQGAFFFAPSFVRALMLFASWWTVFTWALQSCVVLALFRFGVLSSTA